jgi:hypothetical protein
MISIFLRLLFLSVIAFADKNYIIDDIKLLKQNGWILVDETLNIEKKQKIDTAVNNIKLFEYKNAESSECVSIKKGCTSSR